MVEWRIDYLRFLLSLPSDLLSCGPYKRKQIIDIISFINVERFVCVVR